MRDDLMDGEPVIHSHHTDVLHYSHNLARESVNCIICGVLVHADNNECMQTWIEYKGKGICSKCAKTTLFADGVLDTSVFA